MQQSQDMFLEKSRQNFLRALYIGKREITAHEVQTRSQKLKLDWLQPPLVLAVVAPFYIDVPLDEKDALLLDYESFIAHRLQTSGYHGTCVTDSSERFVVMLSLNKEFHHPVNLDDYFILLHEELFQQFGQELFIAIGGIVDTPNKVDISYADAIEMLAYRYQYSSKGVMNIATLMRFAHTRYVNTPVEVERVVGCFHDGDLGKMSLYLDELIENVRYRPGVSKTSIRRTMIELLIKILNIASNAGVDADEILEGRDPYRWILDQGRTEIITEWFMQVCSRLLVKINEAKQNQEQDAVRMACNFVESNLHSNTLSLQLVSDFVGLSAPYFSQMFKQEMGEGLSSYITRCRIERAKILLTTTDLQNDEVAVQTGFSSPSYFSTVFRSKTGMSPGEFRKKR